MSQSPISRRQLLKVLAAAAGTAVLSSVPIKWKTPVVEVGMLPAHAQSLSGFGAIQVTVIDNTGGGAPIRTSKAPAPVTPLCDLASNLANVTIPTLLLEHCFGFGGGSFKFTNIPPGVYTVHCETNFCASPATDQSAHVVAGGTVTITCDVGNCG